MAISVLHAPVPPDREANACIVVAAPSWYSELVDSLAASKLTR